jgi:FlaG/FlaF family flagellin (archaellin)
MKGIWKFLEDDAGVENAVYSILMIAIVVIVALMIGSLVLSRGGQLQVLAGTPKASLTGVLNGGSDPTLLINHESGDPLNATQLTLSVFDDNGVLIGTTNTGSVSPPVTPTMLSSGMQTSAIPLSINAGQGIVPGSRYTIKATNVQSKQQVSMMVLVAR